MTDRERQAVNDRQREASRDWNRQRNFVKIKNFGELESILARKSAEVLFLWTC
jgi:hypothetical protein